LTAQQLSLLPVSKRVVLMRYADRGTDALGGFTLFRCRRCGAEVKHRIELRVGVNAGDITSKEISRGIPCEGCNGKRNPPFKG
jgi:hypothetical protein